MKYTVMNRILLTLPDNSIAACIIKDDITYLMPIREYALDTYREGILNDERRSTGSQRPLASLTPTFNKLLSLTSARLFVDCTIEA